MKSILLQTLAACFAMIINVLPTNGENLNSTSKNEPSLAVNSSDPGNDPANVTFVINNLDSVYFDISQATFIGNSVEIPVYFKSDDVVNAIGFAFAFNETVLEYDTIIMVASYFDNPIFSYNAIDSVVRFEGFSFIQPLVNDTVLLRVRFNLLSGQICDNQFDSTWTSLNGDVCSSILKGCQTIGLDDINVDELFKIYPNPATDVVYVDAPEKAKFELFDINGKKMLEQNSEISGTKSVIQTSSLAEGIYILKLNYQDVISMKKIIITK